MVSKRITIAFCTLLLVLSWGSSAPTSGDGNNDSTYIVKRIFFDEQEVEVSYPSIVFAQKNENQQAINDLLKKEAFREIDDLACSIESLPQLGPRV
jgi:hypothetical protein